MVIMSLFLRGLELVIVMSLFLRGLQLVVVMLVRKFQLVICMVSTVTGVRSRGDGWRCVVIPLLRNVGRRGYG